MRLLLPVFDCFVAMFALSRLSQCSKAWLSRQVHCSSPRRQRAVSSLAVASSLTPESTGETASDGDRPKFTIYYNDVYEGTCGTTLGLQHGTVDCVLRKDAHLL